MERAVQNVRIPAATGDEPEWEQQQAYIINLADIKAEDLPLVGSKAYHLGLLLQAGFPVPKGFCITTHSFHESVSSGNNKAAVIPKFLKEDILEAYRKARISVAVVRSSAIEEDRPEASWAGIYPTTLHVITEQELLAAIAKCFCSLYGSSASLYRKHIGNGDRPGSLGMAVLVQETVDADAAGVMFTMNPLTRNRNEMCINAVPGLGEPLLSGEVSGDAFTVTQEGQILHQQISEKPNMLSKVGEIPVPENKRRWPTISSYRIKDLVEEGRKVENYFGCPQDIEFAVSKGKICIIQSRPIPEKHPRQDNEPDRIDDYINREREKLQHKVDAMQRSHELRGNEAIFSAGNITELLPTPTPMSFGLFRYIFAGEEGAIFTGRRLLGYRLPEGVTGHLFELICGHPYFNLEIDAATYDIGVPLNIQNYIDQVRDNPSLANYPELGLYEQTLTHDDLVAYYGAKEGSRYFQIYTAFRENIVAYGKRFLQEFSGKTELEFKNYIETENQIDYCNLSTEYLVGKFRTLLEHLRSYSCVKFVIAARLGFLFTEVIRARLQSLFGESGTLMFSKLLQGLEGSRITQQSIDLENLAYGRLTPEEFLSEYGHLAPNELEISVPRYADDPGYLEQLLREIRSSGQGTTRTFREQVLSRQSLEKEVRQKLLEAGKGENDIDGFFSDLQIAQAYLPLRETLKYYFAGEYALVRKVLLELEQRLELVPDDIFYLYPEELPECLAHLELVSAKIKRRKEERRLARILAQEKRMPSVIFNSNLGALGKRNSIITSHQIQGIPVSPGETSGIVRILDAETIDLPAMMQGMDGEEIIVMRSANLGVAALFRKAAGLIIEVGGFLAHSACQARESGIPAVVMENAMVLLQDGMRVRVDGNSGTVSLIDCESDP
jgi:pyruvate,water dikinase